MTRIISMLAIALLACYTQSTSTHAAYVYSPPEMTSSLAGDAILQHPTSSGDAIGDGSLSKSGASDAASTPRGLGWHLGGKPISTAAMAPGRRRRRHISAANSIEVDAQHVPSSIVRHRRHLSDDNGRRQVLSVPHGGAAKRVRREWDDSVLSWIKRSNEDDTRKISVSPSSSEYFNDLHSDSDVGNDREPAERINVVDLNDAPGTSSVGKRRWDEADLAWLKRYSGSANDDVREHGKRSWDDSVLTWIKRSGHRLPQLVDVADDGSRPFQRKQPDFEKRLWDDHEMAWLKK